MNRNAVNIISSERGYKGYFVVDRYKLRHALFAGGETHPLHRECMERGHAAAILAWDPLRDKIILLEQFRIGAWAAGEENPWLREIIAGIIEQGENPENVALREAIEEADCEILALEPVCRYYSSPGCMSETIMLYCGCVDSTGLGGIHGLAEEGEDIRVSVVDFEKARQWLEEGQLNNASTMIAMQWLIINHSKMKKKWQHLIKK